MAASPPAVAQAVPLLWVPGWNFLGTTYSASIVEAFYVFVACGGTGTTSVGGNCGGSAPIGADGFVYTQHLRPTDRPVLESGRRLVRVGRLRFRCADW